MDIEILGTESLGVRGLCCCVSTKLQKILIDPGVALGYLREGLLPHPLQIAVDERIREKIVSAWKQATDIIISHFHGDHIPLFQPNPYQLSIQKIAGINPQATIWAKLSSLTHLERSRAESFSQALTNKIVEAEEKKQDAMAFSKMVPHGTNDRNETVMMTRIEEDSIFVHASDIQLLNDEAIELIINWKPDIVLASGPPLYLKRLSGKQVQAARKNALQLAEVVETIIIDHHLLRDMNGVSWLDALHKETGGRIICGADFMQKPRMLLEAQRKKLYRELPVPEGWHEAYGRGAVSTNDFYEMGGNIV